MKNNEYLKMIFLLIKKYKIHFLFVFSLIIALSEFVLAIKMDVLISTLSLGENKKFFFIAGILVILCIIIGKLKSVLGKKTEMKEKECCQLISDDLIKNIEKIPFRKFENNGEGGWTTLLLSDVNTLSSVVSYVSVSLLLGIVSFVSAMFFGFFTSPILFFFTLILCSVSILIPKYAGKKIENTYVQRQKEQENMQTVLLQVFNSKILLNVFKNEKFGTALFKEKYEKFTEEHLGNMSIEWKMVSIGIGTGLLCDVITLIFSLYLISRGFLTIGQFMGFNILNQNIVWVFHSMPSLYSDWLRGKISAERISEFLSISSKEKLMKEDEEKENIYEKSSGNILKLEDIVFRYDENSSDILDKMNFEINLKDKEKILVTGESGCGKSTLIKILSGLYESVSGIFKIDNEDVKGNRVSIAYVPQQTELFSLSLKDNLLLGRKIDEDNFSRILKLTGVKNIADNLSDGLETEITGRKDMNLSAGQIQKIGLARALLSNDVKLLLMDEPVANLDIKSEKEISDILKNLEYSVLAVSHRNEVFNEYMKVYRMENGKVKEYLNRIDIEIV
jgi:ABC transporter, ATP-binding protein